MAKTILRIALYPAIAIRCLLMGWSWQESYDYEFNFYKWWRR